MAIVTRCPDCGKRDSLPDDHAGQMTVCPVCGWQYVLPGESVGVAVMSVAQIPVSVNEVVRQTPTDARQPDFYDRLWGRVVRFFHCERCHRFRLAKLLFAGPVCGECHRRHRAARKARDNEIAVAEARLRERCLALLTALIPVEQDSEERINAILQEYAERGGKDPESAYNEFTRIRRFHWLDRRKFPIIHHPGIGLHPGEIAHFSFDNVKLIRHEVVGRRMVGAYSGITFFDKGFGLTLGGSEGHVEEETADVTLGVGRLVLTSHRLVFSSSSVGFDALWEQLASVTYKRRRSSIYLVPLTGGVSEPLRFGCDDPQYVCACCNVLQGA